MDEGAFVTEGAHVVGQGVVGCEGFGRIGWTDGTSAMEGACSAGGQMSK